MNKFQEALNELKKTCKYDVKVDGEPICLEADRKAIDTLQELIDKENSSGDENKSEVDNIMKFMKERRRCFGCKYAQKISAQDGWKFTGCTCEPYKGKWVFEIKVCPLEIIRGDYE